MTTYKNEIDSMNDAELLELLEAKGIEQHIEEDRTFDSDYIIELIEYHEGTVFDCREADILDSIRNGNWTDAVEQMQDTDEGYLFPSAISDYIENYRYEMSEEAYSWFDLGSMSGLCSVFYDARAKEVA